MLVSIAYGQGKFVSVGSRGTIVISSDAVNWINLTPGSSDLTAIAAEPDRLVAVGDGGIASSTDAVTWSHQNAGTLHGVVYGGGQYVAVGEKPVALPPHDAFHRPFY